jgi:uncharacterized protein with von Willebrand factor type A (vWA) domain
MGAENRTQGIGAGFDSAEIERRLQPLDALGRGLWLPAIVNSEGAVLARVAALAQWRVRLLAGDARLDAADGWPGADVAEAFNRVFEQLGLVSIARAQAGIAEQVQRTVLWHLDRLAGMAGTMGRERAVAAGAQAFRDDWLLRGEELRQVLRLFESLDGVVNFARWSEISGLLRSEGWQAMLRARERIAGMPGLAALIERLGRSRPLDEAVLQDTARRPDTAQPTPRWVRRVRSVETPGVPIETEGVRRSGELARLLSSELVQWRGRRRLLAARLAEQTLLTYHFRQFTTETAWVRQPGVPQASQPRAQPRLVRGPLIVCVDTSASMAGAPEQVAKAIVLEAARVARAEQRACLLYAWSGPGNLARRVLGDEDGLFEIAGFLAASFHGGTDVADLFERVLDDLDQALWRQADLLVASDGEFGVPAALLARLQAQRTAIGLRIQGVLIGDRQTIGMSRVCDDVFWVRDWRRHGRHGQEDSPVHSSRLTDLYFPSAGGA